MIWQDQMKQVVQSIVIDNVHVTDCLPAALRFCKHDTSYVLGNWEDGDCFRALRYRATRTSEGTVSSPILPIRQCWFNNG